MFHCGMDLQLSNQHVLRDRLRLQLITCLQIPNTEIKSAIINTDIPDHFLIFFVAKVNVDVNIKTGQYILKRNICD